MAQHKFKVKLIGEGGTQVAALKPPFYVIAVFQRKGRVPVKGTINGFPFRSSLIGRSTWIRTGSIVSGSLRQWFASVDSPGR